MLEAFANNRIDAARARRLMFGAFAGAALIAGLGYFLASTAKSVMAATEEEEEEPVIPVALVETPEEKPPEVEQPEPEEPSDPSPGPRGPAPPVMPTDIPEHQRKAAQDTYGDGDKPIQFGTGGNGGSGKGPAPAPKKEEKKEEPKPKAAKPKLSPEDYDPPKCKASRIDAAAAKATGVEGTVVVKYTVTETGAVTNVAVVSGPPELHALAVAAAQRTTCEPARLKADGSAISISRKVPFRVRFSTK
ncbi:MAG: TonB family protein [Myxococcales bacterium]|nr:TonB family protein [Myxococcales bacterium]